MSQPRPPAKRGSAKKSPAKKPLVGNASRRPAARRPPEPTSVLLEPFPPRETLRDKLEKVGLRHAKAQVAAASAALVILLIALAAVWPNSPDKSGALSESNGATTETTTGPPETDPSSGLPLADVAKASANAPVVTGSDPPTAPGVKGVDPAKKAKFAALPMGKGVTKDTIKLGLAWSDPQSTGAVAQGLGIQLETGPGRNKTGAAIIDWVNAHGGIAGRKVVPVWHEHFVPDTASSEGQARDAQAACATFTEDNQVFAFGPGSFVEHTIVECAIEHKTPMVRPLVTCGPWLSEQEYDRAGNYFYNLARFSTQRREQTLVKSLQRQGYFTKGAKVGLLIEDSPGIRQGANEGMKPALKALGVEVAKEIVYPDFIESPWANYVLQFQTAGVTHVMFSASRCEGLPKLLFSRFAEDQRFRPYYGFSSDGMGGGTYENNTSPNQKKNAYGFSMHPNLLSDSFPSQSVKDTVCRQILKKKGLPETSGQDVCDFLFFLKYTLERSSALTPEGLAAAVDKIGTTYISASTYTGATRFVPKRHQGISVVRDFRYNEAKDTFGYTSGPYPAG